MAAKIFLIPTPINSSSGDGLPTVNSEAIHELDYFVVENIRSARRFLARQGLAKTIDELEFVELNEHTLPQDVEGMITPITSQGRSCGILSEAGLPCVADPGNLLVEAAHTKGIEIVPLVGPSSLMLALMASGANGQNFAFNGYLPVKQPDRNRAIKQFEKRSQSEHQTQIFIETPYRNDRLIADLITSCHPNTRLCVAASISEPNQLIRTMTISQWQKIQKTIEIGKRPAIFIIW